MAGTEEDVRDFAMPIESLGLKVRRVRPAMPGPSSHSRRSQRIPSRMPATISSDERSASVSSMRRMNVPPWCRAKSQLNSAVRAPPTCRYPVGEGANRTRGRSIPSSYSATSPRCSAEPRDRRASSSPRQTCRSRLSAPPWFVAPDAVGPRQYSIREDHEAPERIRHEAVDDRRQSRLRSNRQVWTAPARRLNDAPCRSARVDRYHGSELSAPNHANSA